MKSDNVFILIITHSCGDVTVFSRESIEECLQCVLSLDISTITSFSVSRF